MPLLVTLVRRRAGAPARAAGTRSASTCCSRWSVTASVQLVGVYLVFASLIVPALGGRNHPAGTAWPLRCGVVGVAGYAIGLLLSAAFDEGLPGAVVVWSWRHAPPSLCRRHQDRRDRGLARGIERHDLRDQRRAVARAGSP